MVEDKSELVLVLAPSENDSAVAADVLRQDGLKATGCRDFHALVRQVQAGCAVIVIAEEALPIEHLPMLQSILNNQEPWSDIPVILLTGEGPARSWESFSASGNISILERPFSRLTLVRAVEVALRARKKQYEVRDLLSQERDASRRRDEFFAALSHELRTPLNVILGWIEILRAGDMDEASQMDALAVLGRNAQMQKALIDDLLDTSRIITGKLHFEPRPLSLNILLQSAQRSFALPAKEKNLVMTLETPAEECVVSADEQRLTQVISNLMTNAIKFTPEHGRILITLKKSDEDYVVSVKDTGIGIDSAFLPYVFDSLKQEDMSTTRSHGGLGLGLAIASHIVQQHKGRIEVKSDGRGKGAEFIFTLPALLASTVEVKPHVTELKELSGVKVLVVDDSPDILQLIDLWLKRAKADVKLVHSGEEALKALPIFKPDILLSDIGMPSMDGYQLITKVRELSDTEVRDVQAIALTAYAKDEERTKALNAGFQMHISKPISNQQLVSAVSSLATRH